MNDKQFQDLLNKVADALTEYSTLLDQAEVEYERRFGFNPSDRDDDHWIDSFHGSGGIGSYRTVAQVAASAKLCKKIK